MLSPYSIPRLSTCSMWREYLYLKMKRRIKGRLAVQYCYLILATHAFLLGRLRDQRSKRTRGLLGPCRDIAEAKNWPLKRSSWTMTIKANMFSTMVHLRWNPCSFFKEQCHLRTNMNHKAYTALIHLKHACQLSQSVMFLKMAKNR